MTRRYTPLIPVSLAGYDVCTLSEPAANRVTLDSPAIDVMTDLAQVSAAMVDAPAGLEAAHGYMRARGVRSLFVVADDGRVSGLITASDILGERALRVGQTRGVKRSELRVSDVMTPLHALEVVRIEDVNAAKVGHVVATLQQSGRQHALVLESVPPRGARIRGMFSATEIARRLGVPLQITELARTFAEVEQVLASPQ